MRFKRSQRIQELLLEEISKLVQSGLKDPRIGFATITKVEVSDNLKHAKIFSIGSPGNWIPNERATARTATRMGA